MWHPIKRIKNWFKKRREVITEIDPEEIEKEIEDLKDEKYSHIKDWDNKTIALAIQLHNRYEILSMEEKWRTQENIHLKAFRDLPMENQRVMLRLADFVLQGSLSKEKEMQELKHKLSQANLMLNDKRYMLSRIKYLDSLPK